MAWLGEELGEKAQGALVARCVKDVIELGRRKAQSKSELIEVVPQPRAMSRRQVRLTIHARLAAIAASQPPTRQLERSGGKPEKYANPPWRLLTSGTRVQRRVQGAG
jgi:hypothetical protein